MPSTTTQSTASSGVLGRGNAISFRSRFDGNRQAEGISSGSHQPGRHFVPVIFVVDDGNIRDAIRSVLEDDGLTFEDFATCEATLKFFF